MSVLIIVLILLAHTNTQTLKVNKYSLKIGIYKNITTNSCGLKTFGSTIPELPPQSCFRWHKTITEQQSLMTSIKNGRLANYGEVPYTIYGTLVIQYYPINRSCTGAIISELWIITAKHCAFPEDVDGLVVYSGNSVYRYPRDNNKVIRAVSVWRHSYGDIALIKLSKKIVPNSHIPDANTVCLPATIWPDKYHIEKPGTALLSGWGYVDDYTENSSGLKVVLIKINRYFGSSEIFSNDISSGFACKGDSGGPLVQYVNGRAVLIGVWSYSVTPKKLKDKCGDVKEMVFMSVTYYMKWIRDTILSNQ